MLPSLNFAYAEKRNASDLAAIHHQCFEKPWSESEFETYVTSPHHNILIVLLDNHLCGALIFSEVEDTAEILSLFIAKDYQKSGIGTALLNEFIQSKQKHLTKIWLEVSSVNGQAVAIYTNTGFAIETVRKNYYKKESGAEDALIMTYRY